MKRVCWISVAMLMLAACASEPARETQVVAEPQTEAKQRAAEPVAHGSAASHHIPPAQNPPVTQPPVANEGVAAPLKQVEPSLVCMVNNQFMGRPQIPITVEGKTYFGCCEMCKGKLATDPTSRAAVDPVTGTKVDKASAVIAMNEAGAVMYFENEATLARYAAAR